MSAAMSPNNALLVSAIPAIPPLLLVACVTILFHFARRPSSWVVVQIGGVPTPPDNPKSIAAEFRGRFFWQAGSAILLTALVCMTVYWLIEAVGMGTPLVPFFIAVFLLGVAGGALRGGGPFGRATESILSPTIWDQMSHPISLARWGKVGIVAGFVSPISLVLCVCMAVRAGVVTTSPAALADSMRLLREIGVGGAGLLVAGVIVTYAYISWPATLQPGKTAGAIQEIASSVAFCYGLLLTALLAGAYLPAAALLQGAAKRLMVASNAAKPAEWLKDHELTWSTGEQLLAVLAVLGPVLAGLASGPIARLFRKDSGSGG